MGYNQDLFYDFFRWFMPLNYTGISFPLNVFTHENKGYNQGLFLWLF